ncbi:type III PLP-dependent enzyme [Salinisphaera hydrothermalis]|uniref:type III PLP-dependent enzyme n=1 Tax=Salinisphaera hydrothermalis TaxID=563188 RepID=UPI0033416CE8
MTSTATQVSTILGQIDRTDKQPVLVYHSERLQCKLSEFLAGPFDQIFYPVKANNDPYVLREIGRKIPTFDVASLSEIEAVHPVVENAQYCFSHPIKDPFEILIAYEQYDVRDFVVDTAQELEKLSRLDADRLALLTVHVRISVPNAQALYPLDGKFGAADADAVQLLRAASALGCSVGISFHVGSQNMNPTSFHTAMDLAFRIAEWAGITVSVLNVGGGFPVPYVGDDEIDLLSFFFAITEQWQHRPSLFSNSELWCEPGRSLVAEAGSLVLRIEQRRGNMLYVNDGVYGCLHDGKFHGVVFPCRALWSRGGAAKEYFVLQGPTCDSADCLPYRVCLPSDASVDDRIEVRNIGAYGQVLATGFNGKHTYTRVVLTEAKVASEGVA